MKKTLVLLLLLVPCWAQDFVAVRQSTGVTSEAITVQQPASNNKTVRFVGAYVDCSVACTVSVERNGAAATGTSLTVAKVNPTSTITATATAWRSSNVGSGTVIGQYSVGAGGSVNIDLSKVYMGSAGTGKNLTVKVASASGDYNVIIQWTEAQ